MTYGAFPFGAVPFGSLGETGRAVEGSIETALFTYAATLDPPIAWPNIKFDPAATYTRVEHLPDRNQRLFAKGTNPHLRQGTLRLTVVSPLNAGAPQATRAAGTIARAFPADLDLYDHGVKVRIQGAPIVGQAFPTDAAWVVPVNVRYHAFV